MSNRTGKTQVAGMTLVLTTSTYSPANRIQTATTGTQVTTFAHDLAGNRTQVTEPEGVESYYGWDAAGQMATAEPNGQIMTLTYNAARQRVKRETTDGTTNFLYDNKKLIHETDEDDDPTQSYTSMDDEFGGLISQYDESGGTPVAYYHQFDAQHSTNAVSTDDCSVAQTYKYQAFGLPAGPSSARSSPANDGF